MTIYEMFSSEFGKEKTGKILGYAGKHACGRFGGTNEVPKRKSDRLLFALTEALGYDCYEEGYGCIPLKKEEIVKFLKENRDRVKMRHCADYLSLATGEYDFLTFKEIK